MNIKRYLSLAGLLTCTLLLLASFIVDNSVSYVNPTGTYKLVTNVIKKGEMGYGMNGQICVKPLSPNKIIMTFYFNKGAPGYHSGSFVDTLAYIQNNSIYISPEWDKSCRITFKFNQRGVDVDQKQADLNNGCGFGQGVLADGYYKKISGKTPIIKDPDTGELLK